MKLTSHQLLILLELVDCLLGNGGGAAGGLRVRRDLPPQSRSGSCNSFIDCDLEGKLSFYDQLVGEICLVISICRRLLKNKLKHRNIITKQGVFQDGAGFSTNVQYILYSDSVHSMLFSGRSKHQFIKFLYVFRHLSREL